MFTFCVCKSILQSRLLVCVDIFIVHNRIFRKFSPIIFVDKYVVIWTTFSQIFQHGSALCCNHIYIYYILYIHFYKGLYRFFHELLQHNSIEDYR
jgi:hypothetical protein